MATNEHEGGTGGKFRRRLLRRVPPTPYDRPPSATRGFREPLPSTEAGGSGWLSKFVDPAARVLTKSASRLFSSVFGKGIVNPPGENIDAVEGAPEVKSSPDVREQGGHHDEVSLSTHQDGRDRSSQELISGDDTMFELEQLLKQRSFSRAETERLTELLHSVVIEPSTLPSPVNKNKGKVDEDSNIDPSSSHQAVSHEKKKEKINVSELEVRRDQLVNLHGNVTSGISTNFLEEGFGSPIEIARAYMGSKPLKPGPSTLGLPSQTFYRDKASPSNLPFGNKLINATTTSKSVVCFPVIAADSRNDYMTPKPRGRSALYRLSRSPYCRSMMAANRDHGPYKGNFVEPTRSIEWTPSQSNIRHSGHGQALKRGSSGSDAGCFSNERRVRQKSCSQDLNLSTRANASSSSFLHQESRQDVDLEGLKSIDDRIFQASSLHVPSQSVETARKILHQLDKLKPSPPIKSFEKKVIDVPFYKPSLSAFHESPLKIMSKTDSTEVVNVRGRQILEDPSSSNFARISSSTPSKDEAKEEASPIPSVSRAVAASSSLEMNTSVTSVPDANHSARSMDSNSRGFALISRQDKPVVQIVPDDKIEPTKAENAIIASVEEPSEKSVGLMNAESDMKSTEKEVCFKPLDMQAFNTLSKPHFSPMSTSLTFRATPKEEETVSIFKFGSKGSADIVSQPTSTGISVSFQTGETIVGCPTSESGKASSNPASACNNSVSSTFFTSTGSSASSSSIFSSSTLPKFQFSTGNSTNYSFTGLSAVSSNTGNGALKFEFGSNNSASYLFTGVSTVSTSKGSETSTPGSVFSPISSISPISANGVFGVSTSSTSSGSSSQCTSSSSQNTTRNCETQKNFSEIGIGSLSQASSSSQIGFTISGTKPFTLSSSSNSSLPPAASSSFPISSFPSSSSSFSVTSESTPFSLPSTGFAFGTPTNAPASMLFVSPSRSILPIVSTETTISGASLSPAQPVFGSTSSAMAEEINSGNNLPVAPMAVPSGAQVFQFGSYQNNSAFQNSSPFQAVSNSGFSAGGNFSLGGGGGEKSERKFIRVKRDKLRRK